MQHPHFDSVRKLKTRTPAHSSRGKFIAVFLYASAIAGLLAACSSGQGAGTATEADGSTLYSRTIQAQPAQKEMSEQLSYAPPEEPEPDADGQQEPFNTEEYELINDNPFLDALKNPLSTFSIDVDTASYSNVRRFLTGMSQLPPADAVRIEEFINYFPYDYEAPTGKDPVAVGMTMSAAPWNPDHRLLRVSIKAREIAVDNLPPSNLVFLLDTSGSMADENKLPLLKQSLRILVENLRPQDTVAIVAYAGSAGLVLDATPGNRQQDIIQAFDRLEAGGSTAGGEGILLAYEVAARNFIRGGNNRVILCTDGDFNIGVSSTSELERLIEKKRAENVFLTVLGLGMGNYKDGRMEGLADKGNGNYAYIDNLLEGKKVLGKEIWGNLFAVAKDVKIQIEFNPAKVREYRLIGYENRLLAKEDFNDDTKDAGEMGSGQTVTAFYELVLADSPRSASSAGTTDDLSFQSTTVIPSDNLIVFKLRYKVPTDGQETSELMTMSYREADIFRSFESQEADFRFASSVVEFGMLLRDSPHKAAASYTHVLDTARSALAADPEGYRSEFLRIVQAAELLDRNPDR